MLAVALEIWALLRALKCPGRRSWLILAAVSLASLFVHRLALLPVAGAALAYAIVWPTTDDRPHTSGSVVLPIAIYEPRNRRTAGHWFRGSAVQPNGDVETKRPTSGAWWSVVGGRWSARRIAVALLALALAAAGVAGTILAVRGESRGAGGHIPAGPLQALWLAVGRLSLHRWPGRVGSHPRPPLPVVLVTSG